MAVTFSATIRNLRRARGLTQARLAALWGVDKQSISNWECGRNAPWPPHQAVILDKLKINAPAVRHIRASTSERILKT